MWQILQLQGYNAQKASFSSTIQVKQIGHALLHIDKYNEDYLITLPPLHIEGLIYGAPFVELNSSTYIQSSSGYTAKIDYSGKGWVGGKKNSFTAKLYPSGKEKEVLYSVKGQWTDVFTIHDARAKRDIDIYNAKMARTTPLQVAPLEEQGEYESRRAWRQVAQAIEKGDMDTTHVEKSLIENRQREMRKKEAANQVEWERRYFTRVATDPVFDALAQRIGEKCEPDRTGGIWRWDPKKYEAVLAGSGNHHPNTTAAATATASSNEPQSGGLLAQVQAESQQAPIVLK